jgi:predicted HD phosphohydrolase
VVARRPRRSGGRSGDEALNLVTLRAALDAVLEWQGTQTDKTGAPTLGHLLQVAGLAIKHRPDDTVVAVAALLHDVLEDVSGVDESDIAARFGDQVAEIVRECSDSTGGARDETDWCARKQRYLQRLPLKSDAARFVSLCDKVANARSLELDLKASGTPADFFRSEGFNQADAAVQLWYYSALAGAFQSWPPAGGGRLLSELQRAVDSMRAVLGVAPRPCA